MKNTYEEMSYKYDKLKENERGDKNLKISLLQNQLVETKEQL